MRKISPKKLKALGGKMPYSTIASPRKAVRKSNPIAKAKRDKRYKAHLSSAYWKALRRKVWARMEVADRMVSDYAKYCECGCGQIIEGISEMHLAHLTYARFGHELDTDVQGQTKWCNTREAALRAPRDFQGLGYIKTVLAERIRPNGLAICCGWNSQGFGKKLGFEKVEILLVAHGKDHNDTIVTVERKVA